MHAPTLCGRLSQQRDRLCLTNVQFIQESVHCNPVLGNGALQPPCLNGSLSLCCPWLAITMPNFRLSGSEIEARIAYLNETTASQ